MENLNRILRISYSILNVLFVKNKFVNEKKIKETLNKELNESKNIKQKRDLQLNNDMVGLNFDECIRLLLKHNLIEYKIVEGERFFKLNKIGKFIVDNFEGGAYGN